MRHCATCGLPAGSARFCKGCGRRLPDEAPPVEAPTPRSQQASAPTLAAPPREVRSPRAEPPWAPARTSRRSAPVVGAVLLAGVAAFAAFSAMGDDDDPQTTAAPVTEASSSPTTRPSPTAAASTPAATVPSVEPTTVAPPTAEVSRWAPAATPFYTAIVSSKSDADGGRAAAEADAARIEQAGQRALVFFSSDYSHLRPGYWVAAAGVYSTVDEARSAAASLAAVVPGGTLVYPRCVGTAEQCPGDDVAG